MPIFTTYGPEMVTRGHDLGASGQYLYGVSQFLRSAYAEIGQVMRGMGIGQQADARAVSEGIIG